jgi:prepilin-type N-terminal cleavage/methylation domain-containing protein
MKRNRRNQAGFNLIEVLVAVAITGVVILSIMTLFFMGRRNVYSGKQTSKANAVATRVLEDLALMSAADVLSNFNIDDDTSLADRTILGTSFPDSVLRDTSGTVDSTTDPSGYLARWKDLLPTTDFRGGKLQLVITPANPTDSDNPVSTAQVVRVRGIVYWTEGHRDRTVVFDSSKLYRP